MLAAIAVAAAVAITPQGAGDVKLGATYRSLRDAGLVGKTHPGCELADPRQRIAPLRSPLRGVVTLTRKRKVANVYVTKGAAARGVRSGDRLRKLRRRFPNLKVDRSTEPTFGIALATAPVGIQFAVKATNDRVQAIGVPQIPFCE